MVSLILDSIYPRYGGPMLIVTYEEAWEFTHVAEKYGIPSARQTIRAASSENPALRSDPIRLYALACYWKLGDDTRLQACC